VKTLLAALFLWSAGIVAGEVPASVKEAVQLELAGRLSESLDRYRSALTEEPVLVQDDATALPLTIFVVSKAAHLAIDLGLGEDAWDWGSRLASARNRQAAEAGTLVRMRLFRLQGRGPEALKAYESFTSAWPQGSPGPALLSEVRLARMGSKKPVGSDDLLKRSGGPALWILQGDADRLPSPSDVIGITLVESTRLQVGAFREWNHAQTLISMLKEKGWNPVTEVKISSGTRFHVVYVVSRQPKSDRARLVAEGLFVLP